ncbi:MAG: hypothetical protein A2350_05580 [Candidatus Raymondbacteria bacterium RifOxyB12_full_50_8]|uniref:Heptosyltransferase n=1 Tax=Candidatus Raymondbacteria bacterium RIFOXYD12_FULL_49_13 TaxID=1817890 RepID=A0A1F7FI70_UNCRA|nr:MAG: hypothetical protein A2248_21015 [Candidatus Raymondbacteria bacterium RIFOXYA2_FULL_49_16]OGJ99542.1 MAG: hypothetical protein A2350_05580 [Candidatus Raymondbacteria bacterium RifOxyB12_full_50_8]OGK06271.1 MAG: hypothetical protein A2519_08330 [Candidatus Raymondbacteria bacterium RIFOXYD12_FULL_49_13]OGP40603.1 MAG: hypothetical protein A2324_03085 [Candidatus Raymondbacteria bacterium RIFOXYB2_FULL_49_35]
MKALFIQPRRLGDVLMTTPSVRAFKKAHPDAVLDYMVSDACAAAIQYNPYISAVVSADGSFAAVAARVRRGGYDAVVDFMSIPKTALVSLFSKAGIRSGFARGVRGFLYSHPVAHSGARCYAAMEKARLLAPLSIPVDDWNLELFSGPGEAVAIHALATRLGLDQRTRTIAFSPVSRRAYKRWPAERYALVCDRLRERFGCDFLPVCGPGEEPAVEQVIAACRHKEAFMYPYPLVSFTGLVHLLPFCCMYFGNDNGIRHAAILCGLPTATVFGRPDPLCWTPSGSALHTFVWGREDIESLPDDAVTDMAVRTLAHACAHTGARS